MTRRGPLGAAFLAAAVAAGPAAARAVEPPRPPDSPVRDVPGNGVFGLGQPGRFVPVPEADAETPAAYRRDRTGGDGGQGRDDFDAPRWPAAGAASYGSAPGYPAPMAYPAGGAPGGFPTPLDYADAPATLAPRAVPPRDDRPNDSQRGSKPAERATDSGTTPASPPRVRPAVEEYRPKSPETTVAVLGEVGRPGTYRFREGSVSLGELLGRCGGLASEATGTLRLVRGGRPAESLYSGPAAERFPLQPGDVIVAESRGGRRFGVTAVSHDDRAAPAVPRYVAIGVIGVADRPAVLKIPGEAANVPAMIMSLEQHHLAPRDVVVLAGGSRAVPGDAAGHLANGSVIVFDPKAVDPKAVPSLDAVHDPEGPAAPPAVVVPATPVPPTGSGAMSLLPPSVEVRPAPADSASLAAPSEPLFTTLPATGSPAIESPAVPPPSPAASPAGPFQVAELPPPPPEMSDPSSGLSSLPVVEMLDAPPPSPQRTADLSGSVPIGRPGAGPAEPHVIEVPADAFYGPPTDLPPVPKPVPAPPAPADAAGESDAPKAEAISTESLAVTILIGAVLGTGTFLLIRKLRGPRIGRRAAGLAAAFAPSRNAEPAEEARPVSPRLSERTVERSAPPRATTATDVLADLVANRLPFREEAVVLPATTVRIHGRSPALAKRRIDPPQPVATGPHFAVQPDVETPEFEAAATPEERPAGPRGTTTVRIDPPQPTADPMAPAPTPAEAFARALAARRAAQRRAV